MLNLKELFNKCPFVYVVNDTYYAFGGGVCAPCNDERKKHITLPLHYQEYCEAKNDENLSDEKAFEIFRKVQFIADNVKDDQKDHLNLEAQFKRLNFTEKDKADIEIQLKSMVDFFQKHHLGRQYK